MFSVVMLKSPIIIIIYVSDDDNNNNVLWKLSNQLKCCKNLPLFG